MNIADFLRDKLTQRPGQAQLVVHVSVEWRQELGGAPEADVIIWTDRQLTLDGGDGWHGVDGADMLELAKALEDYKDEHGMTRLKMFTVRQRRGILPP